MEGLGRPRNVGRFSAPGQGRRARHAARRQWAPRGGAGQHLVRFALPLARALPGRLIEVHCTVPLDLARARYRARAGHCHAGHLDDARSDQELWGEPSRPLGLGPVVVVDTSGPVETAKLAATVAQVLATT